MLGEASNKPVSIRGELFDMQERHVRMGSGRQRELRCRDLAEDCVHFQMETSFSVKHLKSRLDCFEQWPSPAICQKRVPIFVMLAPGHEHVARIAHHFHCSELATAALYRATTVARAPAKLTRSRPSE